MHDQAAQLRDLVRRAARENDAPKSGAPQLVAISGSKGGVGTTTLALNVSVALARQGRRVVLADLDLCRADVALLSGIEERQNVSDVLAARRTANEVLQPGPAGIQILAGAWAAAETLDQSTGAHQRLLDQLAALGHCADVVVLDTGNGPSEAARRCWRAADRVLLVATPDAVSVMDAYATIKVLLTGGQLAKIGLIVNRAENADAAENVHRRIAASCQRFLGLAVDDAGHVPTADNMTDLARIAEPLMIRSPESGAGRAIARIAAEIGAAWPCRASA
jgi:flagellar biosynthesis protein FlhG